MFQFSSRCAARFSFIFVALLLVFLVFLIGSAAPAMAAPPAQTPAPGAADLSNSVGALIDLLIALAIGGGVAYVLQMIPQWAAWQSPFKALIVVILTALLGGALASLKVVATAELFAQAPDYARAFISFVVVFVGSQLTYQKGFGAQWVVKQ